MSDGDESAPCFSPDGTQIAFSGEYDGNRDVYVMDRDGGDITREVRTWKRYHGGLAQDVWVYEFATNQDTRLTNFVGTDRLPMWIGNTIYFVSDRDKTLNVFAVTPKPAPRASSTSTVAISCCSTRSPVSVSESTSPLRQTCPIRDQW